MGVEKHKPPKGIEERTVRVHVVEQNTIEIPYDPQDPDFGRWFDQDAGSHTITHGSLVTGLISGKDAFESMANAIETADGPDHYIYLTGWFCDLNVEPRPGTTLDSLLLAADRKFVQVRIMLWDQLILKNNDKVIDRLNDLSVFPRGAAILDDNTINHVPVIPAGLRALVPVIGPPLAINFFLERFSVGSHHQKVLIVKGREGLIAFVGGVDFNVDRINSVSAQKGSPMHDVHCRIEGPGAREVLQMFLDRWMDHPESRRLKAKGVADLRGLTEPVPPSKGVQHVQIGFTYGSGRHHPGIRNVNGDRFYSFAPSGERTAERMFIRAISQAQRFIYMEDQYMVSEHIAIALKVHLADPKLERVIILTPHSAINDHPHVWRMRKEFVRLLFDGVTPDQKKKVTICYRKRFGDAPNAKVIDDNIPESYIHAKMAIFDDKFAIIGSANLGLRSLSHDSEIVAGIFDESQNKPGVIHFAHELRIRLWRKHLALSRREVFDPIAAAAHWSKPDPSSAIGVYDPDADKDSLTAPGNIFVSQTQAEPYGGIPGNEFKP